MWCICLIVGGQATEGAADGDEGTPRQLDDPRAEPLHPNSGCLRRALYRRPLRACWFPRRHWIGHGYSAGRHHHLPVLWNLCQGTIRNGRNEYSPVLENWRQVEYFTQRKQYWRRLWVKVLVVHGSVGCDCCGHSHWWCLCGFGNSSTKTGKKCECNSSMWFLKIFMTVLRQVLVKSSSVLHSKHLFTNIYFKCTHNFYTSLTLYYKSVSLFI